MKIEIQFSYVFYKTDDTPGWFVAFLTGAESEVLRKIKQFGWKTYKLFRGGTSYESVSDCVPCRLDPLVTFLTSYWIYSIELERWFLPGEIIPLPTTKARDADFSFSVTYDDDMNADLDEISDEESELDGRDIFYSVAKVKINGYEFEWEYQDSCFDSFKRFLEELDQNGFAEVSVEEYNYVRFLAWKHEQHVRVKVHDYDGHGKVRECADIEMDGGVFVSKLKVLLNQLQKVHDDYKRAFNRYTDTVGKRRF